MRSSPPRLLPLFRSDGQARVVAELFLFPDRELSLSELARRETAYQAALAVTARVLQPSLLDSLR